MSGPATRCTSPPSLASRYARSIGLLMFGRRSPGCAGMRQGLRSFADALDSCMIPLGLISARQAGVESRPGGRITTGGGVMKLARTRSLVLAAGAASRSRRHRRQKPSSKSRRASPASGWACRRRKSRPASARPGRTKTGHNDFGPFTQFLYRGGITITFQGNTSVTAVAITGHTDRTPSGVGVGSTEKQVKKGVHGVQVPDARGGAGLPCRRVPGRKASDRLHPWPERAGDTGDDRIRDRLAVHPWVALSASPERKIESY